MNKEQISAEFDDFFEFPTSDKSQVSSVSCKLFSMIMVEMALSQSEPAQVSQPVAETYVINKGGSGEFIAIDWKDKEGSYVGLLYSSPPDYEALKLRVTELEAESRTKHEYAMQMLGERDRLQSECDRLRDAAKQALLALHYHTEQTRPIDTSFGAMNALNAALMPAQKEQAK